MYYIHARCAVLALKCMHNINVHISPWLFYATVCAVVCHKSTLYPECLPGMGCAGIYLCHVIWERAKCEIVSRGRMGVQVLQLQVCVVSVYVKLAGLTIHVMQRFTMSYKELQLNLIKCPARNSKFPIRLKKFSHTSTLWFWIKHIY